MKLLINIKAVKKTSSHIKRLKHLFSIILLFSILLSCTKDKNTQILFTSKSANEIGIDFIHKNGHKDRVYKYPEIMGSGVSVIDYDLDGDLDLYFVQSSINQSDQMYKSLFMETGKINFVNVTSELKIDQTSYGIGAVNGDYNNDGFEDIFISNWKSNVLLKNVNGKFFEDISQEANVIQNNELTITSVFADLNNDGWQDIVSINNINYFDKNEPECTMVQGRDYCGPSSYSYLQNNILQNKSGIYQTVPSTYSGVDLKLPSLVLSIFDVSGDGLPDIYIGNDERVNTLWVNQGLFKFLEVGIISGLAINSMARPEASMGIAIGDINSDGKLDLYLTHMWKETNTLYTQKSLGQFSDETNQYKLAKSSYKYTGFGTAFIDFENDGDLDIVVANGSIMRNKDGNYNEPNSFYENTGKQFVTLDNDKTLTNNPIFSSRGLVRADLDNDGDSDIIITNNNAAPEIYINQSQHTNNWIGYSAFNESGRLLENVESIAEYNVKTIRNIQTHSGSYASSSDPRVLMGLGHYDETVNVTIRWNKNEFEQFSELKPNQYHKLIKGEGKSVHSWPKIKANENSQLEENTNPLSLSIKQLMQSSISDSTKQNIKEQFADKANVGLDLCYSLQSYEFINVASFCYEDYFSNNTNIEADTYYLAAINEVNKFDYKQAHIFFDLALPIKPKNWLYCIRKAQAYYNENLFNKARNQLQVCQSIQDDVNNYKLSADIYMAQKKFKKAFEAYREVLIKQPTANNIYYQMGESLKHFQSEKLVNMALAKGGKKKVMLLDNVIGKLVEYNKDAEFHYEKALFANINQDFVKAVNAMARAFELDPTNEKIIRSYALLLETTKQPQQAITLLLKHQAHLSQADSFLVLGSLLSKFNQINNAQEVYIKALSLHPDNIGLLTNLANNYLRANELELSELNYKKIIEIDPDNTNAKAAMKRINQLLQ